MPDDLTVDEKINGAKWRAEQKTAEKHFFELRQPHFPLGFSVCYRNPGDWDIFAAQAPGQLDAFKHLNPNSQTHLKDEQNERAFRIRTRQDKSNEVLVIDERWNPTIDHPRESIKFKSVMGAMLWIMEELMEEPPQVE